MTEGLQEYTQQLTEFQALIQNTAGMASEYNWEIGGTEHLQNITDALAELNDYADKTIYKFSDMQSAFTSFATAGLYTEDALTMSEGIASLTAFMGKGANEYASAAYMFNQAMQQGKMQYYQWRSIEQTSGLGGELTKKLFIETAKSMGKDAPEWDELYNIYDSLGGEEADMAFRDTLADDWLTGDVILQAFKVLNSEAYQVDGQLDKAAMAADGFSEEIINMAETAFAESQKVRTFSQFMDAVIESIGTGWSRVFSSFFGNTTEATEMWTNLMDIVTGDIGTLMDKIGAQADSFAEAGGRTGISDSLINIWNILKNIARIIGGIFGTLFGKTGSGLAKIIKGFAKVTGYVADVLGKVADFVNGINDATEPIFNAKLTIPERLLNLCARFVKVIKDLWTNGLSKVWQGIKEFITALGPQLMTLLEKVMSWVERIKNALISTGIFSSVKTFFNNLSISIDNGISGGVGGFISSLVGSVIKLFEGINLDGFVGTFKDFLTAITGMVSDDGVKGVFGVLGQTIKLKIGVKSLGSVLRDIADIAKEFNGVQASFIQIVGGVLSIIFAMYALDSVDMSMAWRVVLKAIAIKLVIKALFKGFYLGSGVMSTGLAVLGMILLVVGVLMGIAYALKKLVDYWKPLEILCAVLKSIAILIGAVTLMILVIGIISLKNKDRIEAAEMSTRDWGEKVRSVLDAISKSKLNLHLEFGNAFAKKALAVAALVASFVYLIMAVTVYFKNMVPLLKDIDGGTFAKTVSVLLAIFGMVIGFAIIVSSQRFNANANFKNLFSISAVIAALGFAIGTIADAISVIALEFDINSKSATAACIAVATIMGLTYLLMRTMMNFSLKSFNYDSKITSQIFAMGVVLLAISRAVYVIAKAAAVLSNNEVSYAAFGAVEAILLSMAGLIVVLKYATQTFAAQSETGRIGKGSKTAAQMFMLAVEIMAIAGAVYIIALAVKKVAEVDPNRLEVAAATILAIMAAIGIMIVAIKKKTVSFKSFSGSSGGGSFGLVASIAAITGMIFAILAAIGWLLNWERDDGTAVSAADIMEMAKVIGNIMAAIGVMMAVVTGTMIALNLSKVGWKQSALMVTIEAFMYGIIGMVFALIGAMAILMHYDTTSLIGSLKVLGVILAGIGIAMESVIATMFLLNKLDLKTALQMTATLAALGLIMASIAIILGMVIGIAALIRYTNMTSTDLMKGVDVLSSVATVVLIMFAVIATIQKFLLNKGGESTKILASMAGLGILIGGIAVLASMVGLIGNEDTENIWKGVGVISVLAALVTGMYAAIVLLSKNGKTSWGAVAGIAGFILLIGVLSMLTEVFGAFANENEDASHLYACVGVVAALMAVMIAIVAGLVAIAGSGIGSAALLVGIGILGLIIAELVAISVAMLNIGKAAEKIDMYSLDFADAFTSLFDAFSILNDVDFDTFEDKFEEFLDIVEEQLPRLQAITDAIGGSMPDSIIFVEGDLKSVNGSIAISDSANIEGNLSGNVATGNLSGNTTKGTVSLSDESIKQISTSISSSVSVDSSVVGNENKYFSNVAGATAGAVSGLVGGLAQSIGSLKWDIINGWVSGAKTLWNIIFGLEDDTNKDSSLEEYLKGNSDELKELFDADTSDWSAADKGTWDSNNEQLKALEDSYTSATSNISKITQELENPRLVAAEKERKEAELEEEKQRQQQIIEEQRAIQGQQDTLSEKYSGAVDSSYFLDVATNMGASGLMAGAMGEILQRVSEKATDEGKTNDREWLEDALKNQTITLPSGQTFRISLDNLGTAVDSILGVMSVTGS